MKSFRIMTEFSGVESAAWQVKSNPPAVFRSIIQADLTRDSWGFIELHSFMRVLHKSLAG